MADTDESVDTIERERAARRAAEARVRELETEIAQRQSGAARFAEVMENAADLIQCIEADGAYLYANRSWRETLGYTQDELDGLTLFDVVPPEHHELCERMLEQVFEGKRVGPVELSFQTRSGDRLLVEGVLNARLDEQPEWIRGVFRDVTDRRHTEKAKNEFVSSFSRTLRSPLESIRSAVESLDDSIARELSQKAQNLLDLAEHGNSALDRMLEEIFEFEKIRSGLVSLDLDEMDMTGVVRQVVDARQKMATRFDVALTFETGLERGLVFGDRDRLATAVDHLIKIAIAASDTGGSVRVRLDGDEDAVQVSVTDEGPLETSIDSERDSLTLVSRGVATEERGWRATGLEYSVAGSIIEAHGGKLTVLDTDDGTVASVELQLVEPPIEFVAPKRPRVLVCEDDKSCARLLERLLKAGGYDVDVAATATEAQSQLCEHDYAAMTLDLLLPDRDGAELLHEIRQRRSDIPVVVVSASADAERENLSGNAANVVDWLSKPFDVQSLRRAVETAVDRSARDLPRILHVEDDLDFRDMIGGVLEGVAVVSHVSTLTDARAELQQHEDFDLVLLDLMLPDGLGAELLPFLNRPKGRSIPVVIISSGDATEALGAHVSATLVKSQTTEEQLLETISAHLDDAKPRVR
ncbi:MAG: response regulator [Myxococcota bacterium]